MLASFIELLKSIIASHPALISLAAGIFQGGESMVVLAALSKQGVLSIWTAFTLFVIGVLFMDILLFALARAGLFEYFLGEKLTTYLHEKIDFLLKKTIGSRIFVLLLTAKILYGTATPTIIYLGQNRKITVLQYLSYLIPATLIIVVGATLIGLFVSVTYDVFIRIFKDVQFALTGIIIFFVLVIMFQARIRTYARTYIERSSGGTKETQEPRDS